MEMHLGLLFTLMVTVFFTSATLIINLMVQITISVYQANGNLAEPLYQNIKKIWVDEICCQRVFLAYKKKR